MYKKEFVGRKEQIKKFFEIYNTFPETCNIINYYGMTGMGKTTLLNNLEKEMMSRQILFIKIDADYCMKKDLSIGRNTQAKEEILLRMRSQLITKYGFKFSRFNKSLHQYYSNIGLSDDSLEIRTVYNNKINMADEISDLFKDAFPKIALAVSFSRTVGTATASLYEKFKGREGFPKLSKQEKKEQFDETAEIYKKISTDFALDLNENLKKKKIVILIDTYEVLTKEKTGISIVNDDWLKNDIIKNVDNVLWVIAGREQLNWNESFKIQKYQIPVLTQEESLQLLQSAGIDDKALCKEIYKNSNGVPMFLNSCIDRYNELKENTKNIDITKFGNSQTELSENIIRNMSIEDQEILSYLACIGSWNDEFIVSYGSKFITCFSYMRYENLKMKSFIEGNDEGYYSINEVARNLLYKRCNEKIKNATHIYLSYYYKERLNDETINPEEFLEILHKCVDNNVIDEKNDEIAISNLNDIFEKLDYLKQHRKFEDLIEILVTILPRIEEMKDVPGIEKVLSGVYNLLVRTLMEAGLYPKAQEYVARYKTIVSKDTDSYADVIDLESRILIYLEKSEDAINLLEQECKNIPKNKNLKVQLALAYGQQKDDESRNRSIDMINNILQQEDLPKNEEIFFKRSIANTYATYTLSREATPEEKEENNERLKKSVEKYNELLNELKNQNETTEDGIDNQSLQLEIAYLQHGKTTPLSKLAEYEEENGREEEATKIREEALSCINEAVEIRKQILKEDHPNTLKSMNVKANTLSHMKHFDEAIAIYDDIYEKRKNIFGELSTITIKTLRNEGYTYLYKGELSKAVKILEQAISQLEQSDVKDKVSIIEGIQYNIKKYMESS